MIATVAVRLKLGVLDPQGRQVQRSLQGMGYETVQNVRVGRVFDLYLDAVDRDAARRDVEEMCKRLLANTVIEGYEITFRGG